MIIAIDGPSGTGKSTVSKRVAKELGFVYFNTGAMYRSFALFAVRNNVEPKDLDGLLGILPSFTFTIDTDAKCYIGREEVTRELSSPIISEYSSIVSQFEDVRAGLLQIQRAFASQGDAVFEGRDIGTIVFPNADVKIFLTASTEVRAERRYAELKGKFGKEAPPFDEVLEAITERDRRDTERSVAPLKQAEDAVLVDTSTLSIDSVVDKIVSLVHSAKNS